jgi:hypothetical protein
VRVRDIDIQPVQLVDLLWNARGVGSLDIVAEHLRVGPLSLVEATLRKRGSDIYAQGELDSAQLRSLPGGLEVQPLESAGGSVRVRAVGGLFGVRTAVQVLVRPLEGKLVAEPQGLPFAQFARVTLFSDRRLSIAAVAARARGRESGAPPRQPSRWLVTLRARLE